MISFRWLTFLYWIPGNGSHSTTLLDLLVFSDASICFMIAFPPLVNSDNVVALVFIEFLSNAKDRIRFVEQAMTLLVLIGMVFMMIWEIFHSRIPLNLVLLLLVVNLFQSDLYTFHFKYQAKPHFFSLSLLDKSFGSKVMLRQANNYWKRVLEAAKICIC